MATENTAVTIYLPPELEERIVNYCLANQINRKEKDGTIVPSLGKGIVAYLKEIMIDEVKPPHRLTKARLLKSIDEIVEAKLALTKNLSPATTIDRL